MYDVFRDLMVRMEHLAMTALKDLGVHQAIEDPMALLEIQEHQHTFLM